MRVVSAEIHEVRLPLRRPFVAGHGSEAERGVILVRLETDNGVGWGECSALSKPTYSDEWLDGAWDVLKDVLLPDLLAGRVSSLSGNSMAKTAIEMACLDAQLIAEGRSLAQHLGATPATVEVGAVIGLLPDLEQLRTEAARCVEAGYRRIKLKVRPGEAVGLVAAARETMGPDLLLFVDANAAFDREGIGELCALEEFGLALIEQPFGVDELELHAELASQTSTPICLDESLVSVERTREALDAGATSVICLKAPRLGGYEAALEAHDLAAERGVACWVGGMLDTSLARGANLALAALPGCSLPSDLSAPENLLAADIAAPAVMVDGCLAVPTAPGIGIELDHDAIKRFTVRSERLGSL